MRGRRILNNSGESRAEINLAPLMDMMFILLIFLLVTTSFVSETGLDIDRPTSLAAERLPPDALTIGVSAGGVVAIDGRPVGLRSVRARVREYLRLGRGTTVVVVPDARTPSQQLIRVVDECKRAGAPRVTVATEQQ